VARSAPVTASHYLSRRIGADRVIPVLSGGRRLISWSAENLPAVVTNAGTAETYGYDAAFRRVSKRRAGVVTICAEGLWEEVVGGPAKSLYTFNGHVVAMREGSAVTSLHGDHLGSITVATTVGADRHRTITRQEFDPWGQTRSGEISATTRNYTGHDLDATGLLYAGARYYDPELARFISPDSVAPVLEGCCCSSARAYRPGHALLTQRQDEAAAALTPDARSRRRERGGVLPQDALSALQADVRAGRCGPLKIAPMKPDGLALGPLTVAFQEPDLLVIVNDANAKIQKQGFRFDGNRTEQLQVAASMMLAEPQALNRYAYVLNNPLCYVDPTGHKRSFAGCVKYHLASYGIGAWTIGVVAAVCGLATFIAGTILPP
jgi:RHS repeat-associated protein